MAGRRGYRITAFAVVCLAVAYAGYRLATYDPREINYGSLDRNPLAYLTEENPRLVVAELFPGEWDTFCFITSYFPLQEQPELTDLDIPWNNQDGDGTIVLLSAERVQILEIERSGPERFVVENWKRKENCFPWRNTYVRFAGLYHVKPKHYTTITSNLLEIVHE